MTRQLGEIEEKDYRQIRLILFWTRLITFWVVAGAVVVRVLVGDPNAALIGIS